MTPGPVLTVSEIAMHSTIRIECESPDGLLSSGTGFFFNLFSDGDNGVPVIVTNKHVVRGSRKGFFHISLKDKQGLPSYGNHVRFQVDNFESLWVGHPDPDVDLAILVCGQLLNDLTQQGKPPLFCCSDKRAICSNEQSSQLSALEEVTMIGYPNGIWDERNNIPVMRRGITATPFYLDYQGKGEFMIDAACFPGSSGSPVFIINEGGYTSRQGLVVGNRAILLGILYAGPQITATGEIVVVDVPTDMRPVPVSRLMINLGYCIKSLRIMEFEPLLISRGFQPPPGYCPMA